MNKKKILGFALGPIGSAALGFISLPLITWFYSVEDVGRISMLQVVTSFSILLCCLGLDQAYVREYHETNNKPKLLKNSLLPGFVIVSLVYGAVFIINPTYISSLLYEIPSSYLSIVSIACFIAGFISRFLSLILRMEERAIAFSMSQLLPKLLFLTFILCTVLLGLQKDIYNLVTAHALSIIAVFLVFTWNTRREWVASLSESIDWNQSKSLLIFGLPLVVGGLASWGLRVMDKLFLRGLSTFSELGVYSVSMSVASVVSIFAGIFNTIWAPMVYKWVKNGDNLSKVDKVSEHLLAAVFFLVVCTGLFSWVLPYFLPSEYSDIQSLITVCMLGPLFYTLSETTAVGIAVSRKTNFSMLASIWAMLINALGNFLLVPHLGAAGAAISTAFSFWCFYIFRTEFARRVWRDIPSTKTYFIITLLLTVGVLNLLNPYDNLYFIAIWMVLAIIGTSVFKPSISLGSNYLIRAIYKRLA